MKQLKRSWLGLALVLSSVALSAGCAVDAGGNPYGDGEESTEGTAQQELMVPPDPGESCHVTETGVSNGTMTTNGFCCGVAKCNDQETCGDEYGHDVLTCSNCSAFNCGPGAYRPAPPPVSVPIVPAPPKNIKK